MTLGNKVYRGEKGDKGDTEPKGEQGDTVEKGDTGPQGTKGEKGDNGETPVITVVEDTPLTYKLNFKTSADDITTPNLFKSLDEYHVDLSASGSTLNIPLESLILTYQQISTTALRITIAAKDTSTPVLTDIRRITIFNTSSIESLTLNNTTIQLYHPYYNKPVPHEYSLYHNWLQTSGKTPAIYTYLLLASHKICPATSFEDIPNHNYQ